MTTSTQNRYDLRKNADGLWTVYDIFTGEPVRLNGVWLTHCKTEEADDLVDLLNEAYIKRREGPMH